MAYVLYLGTGVSDWNYARTNTMVYHDKGTCIFSVTNRCTLVQYVLYYFLHGYRR